MFIWPHCAHSSPSPHPRRGHHTTHTHTIRTNPSSAITRRKTSNNLDRSVQRNIAHGAEHPVHAFVAERWPPLQYMTYLIGLRHICYSLFGMRGVKRLDAWPHAPVSVCVHDRHGCCGTRTEVGEGVVLWLLWLLLLAFTGVRPNREGEGAAVSWVIMFATICICVAGLRWSWPNYNVESS